MAGNNLERRVVNYLALIVCLAGLIVAVLLMYGATKIEWFHTHPNVEGVVHETGKLIFVTALLAVFWELLAKRSFGDEILAKVNLSKELIQAGIRSATPNFNRGIEWDDLFVQAREIDLFFAWGSTWRHAHTEQLRELTRRERTRVRVVLPDYQEQALVQNLAARFSYTEAQIIEKIKAAEATFRDLASSKGCRAHIEIWLSSRTPTFSSYRLGSTLIVSWYHHKREQSWVPALTLVEGGYLYTFFREDFATMTDPEKGSGRRVFATEGTI